MVLCIYLLFLDLLYAAQNWFWYDGQPYKLDKEIKINNDGFMGIHQGNYSRKLNYIVTLPVEISNSTFADNQQCTSNYQQWSNLPSENINGISGLF